MILYVYCLASTGSFQLFQLMVGTLRIHLPSTLFMLQFEEHQPGFLWFPSNSVLLGVLNAFLRCPAWCWMVCLPSRGHVCLCWIVCPPSRGLVSPSPCLSLPLSPIVSPHVCLCWMVRPPSRGLVSPPLVSHCLPTCVPVSDGASAFPRPCLPHRYFDTEVFFTKTCFHTWIYTCTCFGPGMVLHANTYAQVFLHRDAFIQKNFCAQTRGYLYRQMPLHSGAFTEEWFYTHVRLHRASFDTNELLHTGYFRVNTLTHRCSLHRQTFVQRRFFRHIYFYKKNARILLRREAFTHTCF